MNHRIIMGDCREALKTLSADSVSLVVTSPPYNVGKEYGKCSDNLPLNEYSEFTKEWISECYRVLTDDGRICVNIPTAIYKPDAGDVFRIYNIMQEIGFNHRELIIWVKRRNSDSRFIVKQKVYGTWNPTNPMLRNPVEAILVMNKNHKRLNCHEKTDLTPKEFLKWSYTIWEIDTEEDRTHPAPFPEELPRRLIKLYSFPEQTILDPFLGSGTTMKATIELGRKSIGIELNPEYVEMAKKRIGFSSVFIEKAKEHKPLPLIPVVEDGYATIEGITYPIPQRIP